ncbi:MAG: YciI family protein [Gemmatimonadetes bacterium]|nr:YciI family protein [Gemmatimonadota bacterium]
MPKFMTLVKGSEDHAPPPPELFAAIDQLMKEAGDRLVGVGGLLNSRKGAKARLSNGVVTVTDGPFTESREVVGGFAIYDVASLDEAKEWTRRFLDAHIRHFPGWDCEVEIRQMMDDPPPTKKSSAGGGLSR